MCDKDCAYSATALLVYRACLVFLLSSRGNCLYPCVPQPRHLTQAMFCFDNFSPLLQSRLLEIKIRFQIYKQNRVLSLFLSLKNHQLSVLLHPIFTARLSRVNRQKRCTAVEQQAWCALSGQIHQKVRTDRNLNVTRKSENGRIPQRERERERRRESVKGRD